MQVKVKSIPVRHNGERFMAGDEFEIDRKGYERIQQHVEVVDESDAKPKAGGDSDLEALRARGKELEIPYAHSMGAEKLTAAIAEKEAELQLRGKAASLGIENTDEMDVEALTAAIAAKGGSGDGS